MQLAIIFNELWLVFMHLLFVCWLISGWSGWAIIGDRTYFYGRGNASHEAYKSLILNPSQATSFSIIKNFKQKKKLFWSSSFCCAILPLLLLISIFRKKIFSLNKIFPFRLLFFCEQCIPRKPPCFCELVNIINDLHWLPACVHSLLSYVNNNWRIVQNHWPRTNNHRTYVYLTCGVIAIKDCWSAHKHKNKQKKN